MDDLIKWLCGLEHKAGDFYSSASNHFKDNEKLSQFLSQLAKDEAWHLQIMENLAELVYSGKAMAKSAFLMDSATASKIEDPFSINDKRLSTGTLTVADMLECIASTEFSEWNDIFLYVIESLRKESRECQSIAAKMQAHKKSIEQFIHSMPEDGKYSDMLRRLPMVWTETILIVDNEPSVLKFLSALLEDDYLVQTAENGQVALDKVRKRYYDIILTDSRMPVMNGIDFYKQATAEIADIGRRFVFFSGSSDDQHLAFLRQNNIPCLPKPAPLKDILETVRCILSKRMEKGLIC